MLKLSTIKYVYLLGIGGIGMSALARYFKAAGKQVCGYDRTPTALTNALEQEGIRVHFNDSVDQLPEYLSGMGENPEALIIYTPAIPKNHAEYNHLLECGYRIWKRSEVLGLITKDATTIAVAGTHGKTTTSTMIAHILRFNNVDCTAFLGGISKNYQTNLLLAGNSADKEVVIVEADEFDRSFLTLHPDIAVITSLDADHLDIYGSHEAMIESYSEFASQVKEDGTLICRSGLKLQGDIVPALTYSIDGASSYKAINVRVENHNYMFDLEAPGQTHRNFVLTWPGRHNVENATGAIAACHTFGISMDGIRKALETFGGVKRRFDYQLRLPQITFIDDYAHHPEELKATILSVRELYPGTKVLGIFQPHLFSRTKDFAHGFGASLSLLDELILLDIYPARELPIPGITSEMIAQKVTIGNKQVCSKEAAVKMVLQSDAPVVLTLGAGDIDELVPVIKQALEKKYLKKTA
jgi:UDP-N-acetylmuramate--alanine ligase